MTKHWLWFAHALYEVGDREEAIRTYADVVRLFPNTRSAAQASLQLGEHYFAANQLEPAEKAYRRAYELGDAPTREHALYKLAWCDFNRTEYAAGIEKLKRSGRREALEDLALFYAHAGEIDDAFAWYRTRAPEQLVRMAALLDEQGNWPLAAETKRRLLSERIGEPVSIRIGLMETLARLGRTEELLAEAKKLELAKATGDVEDRLRALATEQHRAKAYEAARTLYRVHLARFDDPEVRYFHAGVLFELGLFAAAAEQYALVSKGPHRIAAAHDAVIAWEKTLPENADAFVSACRRYAELAPGDRDALPGFLLKAAFVLGSLQRIEEQRALVEEWVARFPNDPLIGKASRLREVLAYQRIQRDEEQARKLSGTARELAVAEIAEAFRGFVEKFPKSKYADEALLSAALMFLQIGRVDGALEASSLLAERYGKSEHAARNTLLYAELHERIADFENAARIYDQFAHDHPKHEKAADALLNAGVHYAAAGKVALARQAFERYAVLHADRPDAIEVRLRACELDLEVKHWKEATRCYEVAGTSVRALTGRAIALSRLKKTKLAQKIFASAVARYSTLPEDQRSKERASAAKAAFELAESEMAAYRKMRIDRPAAFVRMANELEELTGDRGAYPRVIAYGEPEQAVASLTRIGDCFVAMASAMRRAPLPIGLSDEQLDMYVAELEARIVSLTTRAIEAYELALARGRDLAVAGHWIAAAGAGLAALDPDRPDRAPTAVPLDELLETPARTATRTASERKR